MGLTHVDGVATTTTIQCNQFLPSEPYDSATGSRDRCRVFGIGGIIRSNPIVVIVHHKRLDRRSRLIIQVESVQAR